MDVLVAKWGNSLGVRIPTTYARELGLKEGDRVDVSLQDKVELLVKPIRKKLSLAELIAKITPANLPDMAEFETKPVGREVW
jgi:antitoxin MazE